MPLRVVIDTNIWVSGLILPDSTPGAVLDAVRSRQVVPVMSWAVARELVDVLRRPSVKGYGITEGDIDDILVLVGALLPDVDIAVEIRDPDDRPVIAAAIAGHADAIATGDRDILDDASLREWLLGRGVSVLTAAELLARLRTRP